MRKWEYRIEYLPSSVDHSKLTLTMNQWGAQGWEVYAIFASYLCMKRELAEDAPARPAMPQKEIIRRVMGLPDASP